MIGLVASIYARANLADPAAVSRLWQLLNVALVDPVKYDSVERARKPFDVDDSQGPAALFLRDRHLFVKGGKSGFVGMFANDWSGCFTWTLSFKCRDRPADVEAWVAWVLAICDAFPPLFGSMCSRDEYDAKHAMKNAAGAPSAVEGVVGTGAAELRDALPGFYWLTLFGHEAATDLALGKKLPLPKFTATALAEGTMCLRLDDAVAAARMEQRLEVERAAAASLGEVHFFDRDKPGDYSYAPLPRLRDALDDLRLRLEQRLRPGS